MNDFNSWSLPLGRWFGITVRAHLFLLFFMVVMVMRTYTVAPVYVGVAIALQFMLFTAVLLHEFGHCFAARQVDGDADEIILWPLGGLANCQIPNLPWPHFFTAAGGPAVNFLLCLVCFSLLTVFGLLPPISPLWDPYAPEALYSWSAGAKVVQLTGLQAFLARFFYVNWLLFWFNVLIVGFPLDGGRLLQAALWPRMGYHGSMRVAIYVGYGAAIVLAGVSFIFYQKLQEQAMLLFSLAIFIFLACKQQQMQLEMGALGDDSLFGYDFSQGYTSLERTQPAAARQPRQSFWKRWLAQRAEAKRQREAEREVEEKERLDQLLAKIAAEGSAALTSEEQRFLKRVSERFKNRK